MSSVIALSLSHTVFYLLCCAVPSSCRLQCSKGAGFYGEKCLFSSRRINLNFVFVFLLFIYSSKWTKRITKCNAYSSAFFPCIYLYFCSRISFIFLVPDALPLLCGTAWPFSTPTHCCTEKKNPLNHSVYCLHLTVVIV